MFQKSHESLEGAPKLSRPPWITWLRSTISFYHRIGKAQFRLTPSKLTAKQQIMRALLVLSSSPFILSNTVISEPSPLKCLYAHRLHKTSMAGWGKFYKMIRIMQDWSGWREDIKHHIKLSSVFIALPGLGCVPLNLQLAQENWLLRVLVGTAPEWKPGGGTA